MIINMNKKFSISLGFTLIELLVVIAILGVLTIIGFANFRNSQIRSRDTKRKSDLGQIQRALEMYNNDYSSYPLSTNGLITIGISTFDWGEELSDVRGTVYIKELPKDPTNSSSYCYLSADGTTYQIYAMLENTQDPRIGGPYTCGGSSTYNYGVASPNATP